MLDFVAFSLGFFPSELRNFICNKNANCPLVRDIHTHTHTHSVLLISLVIQLAVNLNAFLPQLSSAEVNQSPSQAKPSASASPDTIQGEGNYVSPTVF